MIKDKSFCRILYDKGSKGDRGRRVRSVHKRKSTKVGVTGLVL